MGKEIQQRLQWIKMYEECDAAGLVYQRRGIQGQYYASGLSDWKARAEAPIHLQSQVSILK